MLAAICAALSFVGILVGAFALSVALLAGESFAACGALLMAAYCAGEFVVNLDVT
jgi:hypothetical protein